MAEPTMPALATFAWSVSAPGGHLVVVTAPNWLAGLALGLAMLGRSVPAAGFVVEARADGTVIARDLALGHAYVVRAVAPARAEVAPPAPRPELAAREVARAEAARVELARAEPRAEVAEAPRLVEA